MLESGTRLHAVTKKYTPSFNDENEDDIYRALVESTELIERKGIHFTQRSSEWVSDSTRPTIINPILGSSTHYGEMITPYHDHEFYEINYVKSGTLIQLIDGKKFIMKSGDLLFLSPSVKHVNYPVKGTVAYNILMTPKFIKSAESELSDIIKPNYLSNLIKNQVYFMFRETENIDAFNIVTSMLKETFEGIEFQKYENFVLKNGIMRLLILLSSCERMDHIYTSGKNVDDIAARSEKIIQYIKENYASVTLEKVCELFGYTPQHIRRIVLKQTGMNFQMFLQGQRLYHASHLLTHSKLSIREIATAIGLESSEYFSRWFKYQSGHSPTDFREMRTEPKAKI